MADTPATTSAPVRKNLTATEEPGIQGNVSRLDNSEQVAKFQAGWELYLKLRPETKLPAMPNLPVVPVGSPINQTHQAASENYRKQYEANTKAARDYVAAEVAAIWALFE